MDIRYKNYAITQEPLNYVVNKVSIVTAEKGKPENVGNEVLRKLSYHSTLKGALNKLRDKLIDDDLDGIEFLSEAIHQIETCDNMFISYMERTMVEQDG